MTRMSTIYSRLSYGTGTALTGCGVSTKAYAGAVKTEVWILADKIAGLTLSDWAIIVGIACTVITCGVNHPGGTLLWRCMKSAPSRAQHLRRG